MSLVHAFRHLDHKDIDVVYKCLPFVKTLSANPGSHSTPIKERQESLAEALLLARDSFIHTHGKLRRKQKQATSSSRRAALRSSLIRDTEPSEVILDASSNLMSDSSLSSASSSDFEDIGDYDEEIDRNETPRAQDLQKRYLQKPSSRFDTYKYNYSDNKYDTIHQSIPKPSRSIENIHKYAETRLAKSKQKFISSPDLLQKQQQQQRIKYSTQNDPNAESSVSSFTSVSSSSSSISLSRHAEFADDKVLAVTQQYISPADNRKHREHKHQLQQHNTNDTSSSAITGEQTSVTTKSKSSKSHSSKSHKKHSRLSHEKLNRQLPPTPTEGSASAQSPAIHKSPQEEKSPSSVLITSPIINLPSSIIPKLYTVPPTVNPYDPVKDYLPQWLQRTYNYWRWTLKLPQHNVPQRYAVWISLHLSDPSIRYHIQAVSSLADDGKFKTSDDVNAYLLRQASGHIKAQEEIARQEFNTLRMSDSSKMSVVAFNSNFLRVFNKIRHYYHPQRLAIQYYDRVAPRIRQRLNVKFYDRYTIPAVNPNTNTVNATSSPGKLGETANSLVYGGVPVTSSRAPYISIESLMSAAEQADDNFLALPPAKSRLGHLFRHRVGHEVRV